MPVVRQALATASIVMLCLVAFFLGFATAPAMTLQVEQPRQAFSDDEVFNLAQDRISQEQIQVFSDHVNLDIKGAKFAPVAPTSSMLPFLHSGVHTIEIEPDSPDELSVGDIISFLVPEKGMIVHAIVELGWDQFGWYAVTKGYNNPEADPWVVRFEQIQGVLVGVIY